MSRLIQIKEIDPVKGRGMIAQCDVEKDCVILEVPADISILYSQFCPTHCANCFEKIGSDGAEDYRCPDCKHFVLCKKCIHDATRKDEEQKKTESEGAENTKEEQKGVSPMIQSHQLPCRWFCALPEDAKAGDTDYVRFVLEYASRVQSGDMRLILSFNELCNLETSQSTEAKQFCLGFSTLMVKTFAPLGLLLDTQALYSTLLKVKCNSFGFPFDNKETLGWSLQEEICMLNHSCCPNSAITISSGNSLQRCRKIQLRALRNIKEGEEFTISYIHVPDFPDVASRRRKLLEQYRFLCKCDLCEPTTVTAEQTEKKDPSPNSQTEVD